MYRKVSLFIAMVGLIFSLGSSISEAATTSAATCTPTVSAQKIKENSVTLKVTCAALKSTKVTVKMTLENNDDDDSTSNKTATVKLSKAGVANIKIVGLDAATSYSAKVKVKKSSGSYSVSSSSIDFSTKGSDYSPEIDTIKSITESSAKLNIVCDDLDKDAVNVQVAYKKKTSWSTKTFDLTLDSDGEGSVTLDGLKSDTAYSFKIRIKKSGESNYSAYSAIKTAATED